MDGLAFAPPSSFPFPRRLAAHEDETIGRRVVMNSVETGQGLVIPPPSETAEPAPYCSPRGAERWVRGLPLAHVGETARQVYSALRDLNRRVLANAPRLKILAVLAEPVAFVTESLERHYLEQPLPLSEKRLKVARLARALQLETALGYKIAIENALAGRQGRLDGRSLRKAVYGGLHYLGETLLQSYLTYAAPPLGVWLEAHRLYALAEHNRLHREVVQGFLSDRRPAGSVAESYKAMLLLATANPYRLSQREIRTLNGHLPEWARRAALHPLLDPHHPPGLFVVDLDEDAPPAYYLPLKDDGRLARLRILDVSGVAELTRHFLETASCSVGKSLPPSTFRRLCLAWGAPPKRGFARTPRRTPVQLVAGLGAAHQAIERARGARPTGPEPEPAQFVDDSEPPPPMPLGDVWDLAENPALQTLLDDSRLGEPDPVDLRTLGGGAEEAPLPYRVTTCELVNESPSGCCLRCGDGDGPLIVVGMLIAVQGHPGAKGEWAVGVVRWIRHEEGGFFLGAELIGPGAEPVHVRRVVAGQARGEPQAALLVPPVRSLNQPETLIAPALFDAGDELLLSRAEGQERVRLLKALECTRSFGQYQYLRLSLPQAPSPGGDDKDEFEEIWTYL